MGVVVKVVDGVAVFVGLSVTLGVVDFVVILEVAGFVLGAVEGCSAVVIVQSEPTENGI